MSLRAPTCPPKSLGAFGAVGAKSWWHATKTLVHQAGQRLKDEAVNTNLLSVGRSLVDEDYWGGVNAGHAWKPTWVREVTLPPRKGRSWSFADYWAYIRVVQRALRSKNCKVCIRVASELDKLLERTYNEVLSWKLKAPSPYRAWQWLSTMDVIQAQCVLQGGTFFNLAVVMPLAGRWIASVKRKGAGIPWVRRLEEQKSIWQEKKGGTGLLRLP